MRLSSIRRAAVAAFTCVLMSAAVVVQGVNAAPTAPVHSTKQIAGTVETRMVINRFSAQGRRIVGHGTVTSTLRNAAGTTTSRTQKPFKLSLRQQQLQSGPGPCQILLLELDELDLTLLGLRVFLRSATPGEPVRLTLTADSTHGILGKLFCDLAQTGSGSIAPTPPKAKITATTLTRKLKSATILQANATLYAPKTQPARTTSGATSSRAMQEDPLAQCQVLHLILGPLHVDLLGLIVDLNKIALDLYAIPGTTLGDLFCELVGGPPTAPTPAPALQPAG
jgi:hypothetical protein